MGVARRRRAAKGLVICNLILPFFFQRACPAMYQLEDFCKENSQESQEEVLI